VSLYYESNKKGPFFSLELFLTGLVVCGVNHRLSIPARAAGKVCTVVNLGLATAESLQLRLGQPLLNLYISQKLIFMTLSPSMYPISMG